MSLSAAIRRADRQPLGTVEEVKTRLTEAFPGVQFTLVETPGPNPIPRFSRLGIFLAIWSLLGLVRHPPYPHWHGLFQGIGAAEFTFDQKEPIRIIEVMLYGRTTGLVPHFANLSANTGWEIKYPGW
jgi:hypothetical protein